MRAEIGKTASGQLLRMVRAVAPSGAGGSASTTWALVPPKPNELTPATRRLQSGNGRPVLRNVNTQLPQRNLIAWVLEMQVRRNVPMFEYQRSFDQSGDACAGLEMADVGFDRPDHERVRCRTFRGECIGESPDLDWVADRCSGAVCLHITDFVGLHPGSSQGCRDGCFLGLCAWHGDAVGVAVLGYRCAQDLRVDVITVAQRLGQRFDYDDGTTFAPRVTVSGLVECLAPPVRCEKSALGFRDRRVGTDHDVDATGKCDVAFAVPDALRGKVYRDERARACSIDGHAGPAEVEGERDPVRQHRHHHSGGGMGFELVTARATLVLEELIVEGETADEHADVSAGETVGGYPAVFQRFPCGPQQEALLRIEQVRLARRDAEELRIELIDLAEEPASTGNHLADLGRVRVMVFGGVPACFGNDAGRVGLTTQQIPVAFRSDERRPESGSRCRRSARGLLVPCSASVFNLST